MWPGGLRELSVCEGPPCRQEACVCIMFIYLFFYYLFIYFLLKHLLFIYFKRAFYQVIYQF